MAANPNQIPEDLATLSPYLPTSAEVEHHLTQLRSRLPQPDLNPPRPLNLFVILVGDSCKARKGTSWNLFAGPAPQRPLCRARL